LAANSRVDASNGEYPDRYQRDSPAQVIPDSVERFILTSVPSVPYLEAMLWLRAHPGADHGVEEVARALYLAEGTARELLLALMDSGVLVQSGAVASARFRYRPRDARLAAQIDALSVAYAENLVAIAQLVHDATRRNAHRFADAFKLRKDT
jgi:hypothetical protein